MLSCGKSGQSNESEPVASSSDAGVVSSSSEPSSTITRTDSGKAPSITFYGDKEVTARNDSSVFLPGYDIKDGNGDKMDSSELTITHTIDGEESSQPYVSGTSYRGVYDVGTHVFLFRLTDSLNGLATEDTVVLTITRRLLYDEGGDPYCTVSDEGTTEESYSTTNTGISVKNLYMDRSYEYYAEASFNGFSSSLYRAFGFMHCDDTNPNSAVFYRENVAAYGGDADKWYLREAKQWSAVYINSSEWFSHGTDAVYAQKLTLNDPTVKNKVAIARNHDKFYFFLNDVLLRTHTIAEFKYIKTIPGICVEDYGNGDNAGKGFVTDIDFYSGEKALAKIETLTAGTTLFHTLRDDTGSSTAFASYVSNEEDGEGFEYNENIYDNDAGWWNKVVWPQMSFADDYRLSFDYEVTGVNASASDAQVRIYTEESSSGSNGEKTDGPNLYSSLSLKYGSGTSFIASESSFGKTNWEGVLSGLSNMKTALGESSSGKDGFHIEITCENERNSLTTEFTYSFSSLEDSSKTYEYAYEVSRSEIKPLFIWFGAVDMTFKVSHFEVEPLSSLNYD